MKKVDIIPIAERKLARRGIKRETVEDAVINPSQIVEGYGGRKVAHKKVFVYDKEYLLRAVYEETEEMFISSDSVSYIPDRPLLGGGRIDENRI